LHGVILATVLKPYTLYHIVIPFFSWPISCIGWCCFCCIT